MTRASRTARGGQLGPGTERSVTEHIAIAGPCTACGLALAASRNQKLVPSYAAKNSTPERCRGRPSPSTTAARRHSLALGSDTTPGSRRAKRREDRAWSGNRRTSRTSPGEKSTAAAWGDSRRSGHTAAGGRSMAEALSRSRPDTTDHSPGKPARHNKGRLPGRPMSSSPHGHRRRRPLPAAGRRPSAGPHRTGDQATDRSSCFSLAKTSWLQTPDQRVGASARVAKTVRCCGWPVRLTMVPSRASPSRFARRPNSGGLDRSPRRFEPHGPLGCFEPGVGTAAPGGSGTVTGAGSLSTGWGPAGGGLSPASGPLVGWG